MLKRLKHDIRPIVTYVFPAVEVAKIANLSLDNANQRVTGSLTEDKLLDVGGLNLAAVVDDLTTGVDDNLSNVKAVALNLRVAQRDIDLSLAGSRSNAAHLVRVRFQAVLVVLLEKGQRVLVVDTPSPVGVSIINN